MTKLICTIGPETGTVEVLEELLHTGMSCARFDFTYGTLDSSAANTLFLLLIHSLPLCLLIICMLEKSGMYMYIQLVIVARSSCRRTPSRCAPSLHPQTETLPLPRASFPPPDAAGTKEYHQRSIDNLRNAIANTRKMCCTMMDTRGPEITVINHTAPIELKAGQELIVSGDVSRASDGACIVLDLENVHELVEPGRQLFVGQYLFTGAETSSAYMTVKDVRGKDVICAVNNSCRLEGMLLTVHIANLRNPKPILHEKDVDVIKTWCVDNKIDTISLSFTRNGRDIREVRELLKQTGQTSTGIIAKIESLEGLINYAEILEEADGIIVSRGNLGIDLPPEKVFVAQRLLLAEASLAGKNVIVTRVVDTMTSSPRPTRAEATDVANLVLDGADGIMLGAETVRGKFPIDTAKTVLAICRQAEKKFDSADFYKRILEHHGGYDVNRLMSRDEALASAAVRGAAKIEATLILCFTQTGRTPRLVAKYKPPQPILTMVAPRLMNDGIKWRWAGETQAHQIMLSRGCVPCLIDPARPSHIEGAMLANAIQSAITMGLCKKGDRVVVIQCPRRSGNAWTESGVVKNLVRNFFFVALSAVLTMFWGPGDDLFVCQCAMNSGRFRSGRYFS